MLTWLNVLRHLRRHIIKFCTRPARRSKQRFISFCWVCRASLSALACHRRVNYSSGTIGQWWHWHLPVTARLHWSECPPCLWRESDTESQGVLHGLKIVSRFSNGGHISFWTMTRHRDLSRGLALCVFHQSLIARFRIQVIYIPYCFNSWSILTYVGFLYPSLLTPLWLRTHCFWGRSYYLHLCRIFLNYDHNNFRCTTKITPSAEIRATTNRFVVETQRFSASARDALLMVMMFAFVS